MPTPKKADAINELEVDLQNNTLAFVTDYRGLHVSELQQLRGQLRPIGVEFKVAKNTLLRLAAEHEGIRGLEPLLAGPTAVAFASANEMEIARVLTEFARTSKILTVKGGLLDRTVISAEDVAQLATLPPKTQLQADLVGAVNGPMASLIGTLQSAMGAVVHALEERSKQMETAPA